MTKADYGRKIFVYSGCSVARKYSLETYRVDGVHQIRRAEHQHIGPALQSIQRGQHCIHHTHRIARFVAPRGTPSGGGDGLHFVDEHHHHALLVLGDLRDVREELHHELAGLGEPLGEERVRVDFKQNPGAESI